MVCASTMLLLMSNLYIECFDEGGLVFSTMDKLSAKQKEGVYSVLRTGVTNLLQMVGRIEKPKLWLLGGKTESDFLEEKEKAENQVLRQVLPLLVNFNPRRSAENELLLEVDTIPEGLADGVVILFGVLPSLLSISAATRSQPQNATATGSDSKLLVWKKGFKIHIASDDQVFTTR